MRTLESLREMATEQFPSITICGSMRFHGKMILAAHHLSAAGYIVLAPYVTFVGEEQQGENKAMLDQMHIAKIDQSIAVCLVTDNTFYFGESSEREICYADGINLPIFVTPNAERFTQVSVDFLFTARTVFNGR